MGTIECYEARDRRPSCQKKPRDYLLDLSEAYQGSWPPLTAYCLGGTHAELVAIQGQIHDSSIVDTSLAGLWDGGMPIMTLSGHIMNPIRTL